MAQVVGYSFHVKWGMVIDLDKCTGCGACMVSCQTENNIAPPKDGEASDKRRTLTWMLIYELSNKKPYPDHEVAYLPRPCMQCENPACVPVCPVIATKKDEEGGIVSQIYPRCIGCRYCMAACPYHSRYFGWFDPVWPEGLEKTLTPYVSARPRGVVEKCTFCHHKFAAAKEKARMEGRDPMNLEDGEYMPACAEACPTGAISFGDFLNPKHKVHDMIKSPNAFRVLEKLGLNPQVYYYSEREWVRKMGDHYLQHDAMKEEAHHG